MCVPLHYEGKLTIVFWERDGADRNEYSIVNKAILLGVSLASAYADILPNTKGVYFRGEHN